MKKTIITLSALFLIASLSLNAQDDKSKKTEKKAETKDAPAEVKPAGGGTRMAISTKGAPATKSSTGTNATKSKPATTSTISSSTNPDGTPKTN